MSRITLSQRIAIESGIYQSQTFKEIPEKIGISVQTISNEIRLNRTFTPGDKPFGKASRYQSCSNGQGKGYA